jgi:hypothetical protein
MTECKNCGLRFEGAYCPGCRQAAATSRISWNFLYHRGVWYTIRELTVRPGYTIAGYLAGKRERYFNPMLFLILCGGFASVAFLKTGTAPPNLEISLVRIAAWNSTVAYKYFALVGLVFILLLSATDFLFYKKAGYNLPELIVANLFQAGQIMNFTLMALPLFFIAGWLQSGETGELAVRWLLKLAVVSWLYVTRAQWLRNVMPGFSPLVTLLQLGIVYVLYNVVLLRVIVHWLST